MATKKKRGVKRKQRFTRDKRYTMQKARDAVANTFIKLYKDKPFDTTEAGLSAIITGMRPIEDNVTSAAELLKLYPKKNGYTRERKLILSIMRLQRLYDNKMTGGGKVIKPGYYKYDNQTRLKTQEEQANEANAAIGNPFSGLLSEKVVEVVAIGPNSCILQLRNSNNKEVYISEGLDANYESKYLTPKMGFFGTVDRMGIDKLAELKSGYGIDLATVDTSKYDNNINPDFKTMVLAVKAAAAKNKKEEEGIEMSTFNTHSGNSTPISAEVGVDEVVKTKGESKSEKKTWSSIMEKVPEGSQKKSIIKKIGNKSRLQASENKYDSTTGDDDWSAAERRMADAEATIERFSARITQKMRNRQLRNKLAEVARKVSLAVRNSANALESMKEKKEVNVDESEEEEEDTGEVPAPAAAPIILQPETDFNEDTSKSTSVDIAKIAREVSLAARKAAEALETTKVSEKEGEVEEATEFTPIGKAEEALETKNVVGKTVPGCPSANIKITETDGVFSFNPEEIRPTKNECLNTKTVKTLRLHPDQNQRCSKDATINFQNYTNFCERFKSDKTYEDLREPTDDEIQIALTMLTTSRTSLEKHKQTVENIIANKNIDKTSKKELERCIGTIEIVEVQLEDYKKKFTPIDTIDVVIRAIENNIKDLRILIENAKIVGEDMVTNLASAQPSSLLVRSGPPPPQSVPTPQPPDATPQPPAATPPQSVPTPLQSGAPSPPDAAPLQSGPTQQPSGPTPHPPGPPPPQQEDKEISEHAKIILADYTKKYAKKYTRKNKQSSPQNATFKNQPKPAPKPVIIRPKFDTTIESDLTMIGYDSSKIEIPEIVIITINKNGITINGERVNKELWNAAREKYLGYGKSPDEFELPKYTAGELKFIIDLEARKIAAYINGGTEILINNNKQLDEFKSAVNSVKKSIFSFR